MPYNIWDLGDVHFKPEGARQLYDELYESIIVPLQDQHEEVDAFVFLGDYFHGKVSINSDCAYYATKFLIDVLELMGDKPVRMIKGTKTHDYNQLNFFRFLQNDSRNFEIVNEVTEEQLFDDVVVLYIPEEYPVNWQEYYSQYLEDNDSYDIIFFHGMMDFAAHSSIVIESERQVHSAPVFPADYILERCYVAVGGHVHNWMTYKGDIHYTGSFTRWCFGEEKAKGWIQLSYDPEDGSHSIKRIKNKLAPTYDTIKLSDIWDGESPVEDLVNELNDLKDNKNLRVKNDIDRNEETKATLAVLREHFADDNTLKIDNSGQMTMEKIKSAEDNFEFVKEEGIEPHIAIQKFIAVVNPKLDITEDDILEIITKPSKVSKIKPRRN